MRQGVETTELLDETEQDKLIRGFNLEGERIRLQSQVWLVSSVFVFHELIFRLDLLFFLFVPSP